MIISKRKYKAEQEAAEKLAQSLQEATKTIESQNGQIKEFRQQVERLNGKLAHTRNECSQLDKKIKAAEQAARHVQKVLTKAVISYDFDVRPAIKCADCTLQDANCKKLSVNGSDFCILPKLSFRSKPTLKP